MARARPALHPAVGTTVLTRERLDELARIARVIRACPGVLQLHAGPTGRIASITLGGRLVGLLLQNGLLTVGVLRCPSATNEDVVAQVRAAVAPLAPDLTIRVIVSTSR